MAAAVEEYRDYVIEQTDQLIEDGPVVPTDSHVRLSENDALNEYILHTGSAVFAGPPGAQEGGYVGETLFESA